MKQFIRLLSFALMATLIVTPSVSAVSGSDVIGQTNTHRSVNGLSDLTPNAALNNAATQKARDMCVNSYWAHTSPTGKTGWDFMRENGYSYSKAGENLAAGYTTATGVVNGWMNSPGHRVNMLGSFSEIGVGTFSCPSGLLAEQIVTVALYAVPAGGVAYEPAPEPAQAPAPTPTPQSTPAVQQVSAPAPDPVQALQSTPTPDPEPAEELVVEVDDVELASQASSQETEQARLTTPEPVRSSPQPDSTISPEKFAARFSPTIQFPLVIRSIALWALF